MSGRIGFSFEGSRLRDRYGIGRESVTVNSEARGGACETLHHRGGLRAHLQLGFGKRETRGIGHDSRSGDDN